ncbi:hypothetical protein [Flavobacterium oreochromis]|uniref:PKD domain-containing protein n=1 Tax=Flavobacterium columnare TaxID=996 RepID=A0A2D0AHN2_9FLAO|nr:hypothetical protein [Flavobacterium oreochromis]OWP75676.1 hypothetical protein BWK62_11450 [Flavobacterium oreochromis]
MKQINFNNAGGFPLEQETLKYLQTAYRHELFEAIKAHLSITPENNYIIAEDKKTNQGWLVIHQELPDLETSINLNSKEPIKKNIQGILYPLKLGKGLSTPTQYIKTIRTTTPLNFGDGNLKEVYVDYQAEYITSENIETTEIQENKIINLYNLNNFKKIKDINSISNDISNLFSIVNTLTNKLEDLRQITNTKADKSYVDQVVTQINQLNLQFQQAIQKLTDEKAEKILVDQLIKRIEALEKRPQGSVPIGTIALWDKPANEIPQGWIEYVPLRGRMPIGQDPDYKQKDDRFNHKLNELGYGDGGKREHRLSEEEMPPHSHPYSQSKNYGSASGNANAHPDAGFVDANTGIVGKGAPHTNMPPYCVVHFIQYIGGTVKIANKTINLPMGQSTTGEIELIASVDTIVSQYEWSYADGSALPSHIISNQNTLKLNALTEGIYHYKLSATIGNGIVISGTTSVTVKKNNAPSISNLVPANESITVDTNGIYKVNTSTVEFNATLIDIDNETLTYNWAQIQGPTNTGVNFTGTTIAKSSNIIKLIVNNIEINDSQNPYIFRLSVTDPFGNKTEKDIKIMMKRSIVSQMISNTNGISNHLITITGKPNEELDIKTALLVEVVGGFENINVSGGGSLYLSTPLNFTYNPIKVSVFGKNRASKSTIENYKITIGPEGYTKLNCELSANGIYSNRPLISLSTNEEIIPINRYIFARTEASFTIINDGASTNLDAIFNDGLLD